MYSPLVIHSHIPLPAPHIHSHTLVGLTTEGERKSEVKTELDNKFHQNCQWKYIQANLTFWRWWFAL